MRPGFSRRAIVGALCGLLAADLSAAPLATAARADEPAKETAAAAPGLVEFPAKIPAPALRLADLNGRVYDVPSYRGRVLVVNFWATWCGPCVEEMASMERAWRALRPRGVDMVAVNAGDSAEKVRRFLAAHQVSFPVLLDPTTRIAAAWHVGGLPTTYVVDGDGTIAAGALGGRDWDQPALVAALTRIAAPAPSAAAR